jgi:hypothetical protein
MERPSDIDRILGWPASSWSPDETVRVAEYRRSLVNEMFGITELAERENRNLTSDERELFGVLEAENGRCVDASLAHI